MVLNHLPAESSNFKKACVNFARMVPLMYSYDENQQLPLLEEYLNSKLLKYNNANQGIGAPLHKMNRLVVDSSI